MIKTLSADEGMLAVLETGAGPKSVRLSLAQAYGRVLAEDIMASMSVPPFDKSPFDGYAFISSDTVNASKDAPVMLSITEEIAAGGFPSVPVTRGTAAKILTGAPVPENADTIVKYEDTEYTASEVKLFEYYKPGNIVHAGEDVKAGTVIAHKGDTVNGPVMGVIAAQGIAEVSVYQKPLIGIISTGSELADAGQELGRGRIYNTNSFTLSGILKDLGADVMYGGIVEDEPEIITEKIRELLVKTDMVITTGGAAAGDYDFAERSAELLGSRVLFRKLSFKPGGSMMASVSGGKLILNLSGNPGAAAVGLLRVAAPYIRKLCGRKDLFFDTVEVRLRNRIKKASPQMRFLRGYLEIEGAEAYFTENPSQGNGSISSLINCDLLAEIPEGTPPLEAGTIVKAYRVIKC